MKNNIKLFQIDNSSFEIVFFSKTKHFRKHLYKHFLNTHERWIDLLSETSLKEFRVFYKKARSLNANELPMEELNYAAELFANVVFDGVSRSIDLPLYAFVSEIESIQREKCKPFNRHSSNYFFVAPGGFFVIAELLKNDESKLFIKTAYRPFRVNPYDSSYQVFKRTYSIAKQKLSQDQIVTEETGNIRNIEFVKFVSEENWDKCPAIKRRAK